MGVPKCAKKTDWTIGLISYFISKTRFKAWSKFQRLLENLSILIRLSGPIDDVIIFNFNARMQGIGIWISNEHEFGYLPKPPYPCNDLKVHYFILQQGLYSADVANRQANLRKKQRIAGQDPYEL